MGITLIVLSLIRIFLILRFGTPSSVFWISNHVPLILGLAILFRNSFWILAESTFIFVGEVGWTIDYLFKLSFNKYLVGSTAYMFNPAFATPLKISSLLHLIVVPFGVIAFLLIKKKPKKAWKGVALHLALLLPIIIYYGDNLNLNCLFKSCINWLPTIPLFPIIFPIFYALVCVTPIIYLLNKLISNSSRNK